MSAAPTISTPTNTTPKGTMNTTIVNAKPDTVTRRINSTLDDSSEGTAADITAKEAKQAAKDLRKAAKIMADGRWVKGGWSSVSSFVRPNGRKAFGTCYCAQGAIFAVCKGSKDSFPSVRATPPNRRAVIALAFADATVRGGSIMVYNDHNVRTRDEVVDKVRLGADLAYIFEASK